ncbi:MAG: hypothetical protein M3Y33_08445 [Actinomycetota bacterium]|nr:hypothetical protein [Actinomycetota bacterium]
MKGVPGFEERAEAEWSPGTVRGVRYFTVDETGSLHGAGQGVTWTQGENVAVCRYSPDHVPPHAGDCGCGFWAYWTREAAQSIFASGSRQVIGVIEAYGRTLIGDKGFRAAKARILGVGCMFETSEPPDSAALSAPRTLSARQRGLYESLPGFRASFHAMGGSAPPPDLAKLAAEARRAAAAAAEMATIEAELAIGSLYPDVRVYTSPSILLRIFPPTTDYIPAAEPAGRTVTPYQRPGGAGSFSIAQPSAIASASAVVASATPPYPSAQVRWMHGYFQDFYAPDFLRSPLSGL